MTKSETLTIRLDPRTRFMLDFVARISGQNVSTVIERGIANHAETFRAHAIDENGAEIDLGWRELWHVNEGVRALNVLKCADLHPSYEEERRLDFVKEYWSYFAYEPSLTTYKTSNLDALWRRLDEFLDLRDARKTAGRMAVVEAMNEVLKSAGLTPPPWPQIMSLVQDDDDRQPTATAFDPFGDIPF